jgi:hypothetical protein
MRAQAGEAPQGPRDVWIALERDGWVRRSAWLGRWSEIVVTNPPSVHVLPNVLLVHTNLGNF